MNGDAILELTDPRWQEFVAGHQGATPFHHPDWAGLVAQTYGFRAFALVTRDTAGAIQAGLPVIEVRHFQGGRKWVSLPYTDYCPPLVSGPQDEDQLVSALRQASGEAGVRRVEVRAPLGDAPVNGHTPVRHTLDLTPGPAELYKGFHRSQVQRNIRRAEREGLTVRRGERPEDLVETFYRLHLRTRRRQGVPVQPRRFFRLLWERAISSGLGAVVVVEAAGEPIAAAVFLEWNGTVIYKFGASDANAWSLRPNHLLFWHAIQTASEQGNRWFDFGRTDAGHEGLRNFKLSWGAVEEPLVYGAVGGGSEAAPPTEGRAARALGPVIRHGPLLLCRAAGETLYRYTA
jgi:CelD/BcsL family acetyltransferase involved in cellulose biosynthesis